MSSPVEQYNARFTPQTSEPEAPAPRLVASWGYEKGMALAREIIAAGGIDVLGEKTAPSGDHIFMLKHCAFNPDHTNNDAAIMVSPAGKLKYHCFHNSCSDKGWSDLRAMYASVSSVSKWEQHEQSEAGSSVLKRKSAKVSVPEQARPIMQEVLQYIDQGAGTFHVFDLDRELCYFDRTDKNARARALNYYKNKGLILPVTGRRGQWRVVDGNCKAMRLGAAKTSPVEMHLPLGISDLCSIRPGNIIIVAGSPNAGKSAYVSNLVHSVFNNTTAGEPAGNYAQSAAARMAETICPGQKLECHFFSSEAGEDEMSSRLQLHPGGIDAFKDVQFWERDADFADVVRPNALNIIDFMEVYDDFYKIGAWINDVHRVLDKGIAVIVLQKKRGRDVGKGGDVTMEKPRLYISLENNMPHGGVCKILKAKFPNPGVGNPNGLEIDYKLVDGHQFITRSEWRYVENEKERERINRTYAAELGEKKYMLVFKLIDGTYQGINKKTLEDWISSFPNVNVIGELQRLSDSSEREPFLKKNGWFFTIAGILNKKNAQQKK